MVGPGRSPQRRVDVVRVAPGTPDTPRRTRDIVAVEEPLEIRIRPFGADRGVPIAVTMRTPGEDFDLVAGFLLTEGVLARRDAIHDMTYCRGDDAPQEYNIVEVRLAAGIDVDLARLSRNVFTSSSCGVCGKATLDAIAVGGCTPLPLEGTLRLDASTLASAPDRLRNAQRVFSATGGLHAAALMDGQGALDAVAEDVGRHNAVDKVLGRAFLEERTPLHDRALVVSGRASFEIVQKALVAGVCVVVAVGAPSSLAVDLARRFNVTLAGFVRGQTFNLYTAAGRVTTDDGAVAHAESPE